MVPGRDYILFAGEITVPRAAQAEFGTLALAGFGDPWIGEVDGDSLEMLPQGEGGGDRPKAAALTGTLTELRSLIATLPAPEEQPVDLQPDQETAREQALTQLQMELSQFSNAGEAQTRATELGLDGASLGDDEYCARAEAIVNESARVQGLEFQVDLRCGDAG